MKQFVLIQVDKKLVKVRDYKSFLVKSKPRTREVHTNKKLYNNTLLFILAKLQYNIIPRFVFYYLSPVQQKSFRLEAEKT